MSFFARIPLLLLVVLSLCFTDSDAQLCQGSLGDPIVNITFGAGSNPGAALQAATTSYQYLASDCPGDGFYTVRTNTSSCFGSTWHTLSSDHTGDPNGYFMLINASFQPSAFYLDTVRGLCGGTTYEFAAWIMNVLKPTACSPNPIQPNLTFTIERTDGTILQTYNTNIIPTQSSPTWQQFGFFFTTPVNTSNVVLRLFNNAPGGCGNDLALDDITFRPCGPELIANIEGNGTSMTICEGTVRSFTFSSTLSAGFNDPFFQWQKSNDGTFWTDVAGATTSTLAQNFTATTNPGTYYYRLAAAEAGNMNSIQCRIVSDPVTIKVAANPVTTVTSNSPVCENNSLQLQATGGSSYEWNGVNNFSATGNMVTINSAQTVQSGKYHVRVTNDDNCEHLDSVTVVVNPKPVAQTSFAEETICEGETLQLNVTGGDAYQWSPANSLSASDVAGPIASPDTTTEYTVIVANPFDCKDTSVVKINVITAPAADAGPDKWMIQGTSTQLNAVAGGQNTSFSWMPAVFINDPLALQPIVNPPRDTSYVLTVVSNDGCGTATDTMKVFVYKDVFIPNAFSPNNDGLNDTWHIPALAAYPDFELTIFNRQGQVVFQNKKANRAWDGKYKGEPQPVGAYVYMIDLKTGVAILKGTVMLVR